MSEGRTQGLASAALLASLWVGSSSCETAEKASPAPVQDVNRVHGRVVDEGTGAPIEGAQLVLELLVQPPRALRALTDEEGSFELAGFGYGQAVLECRAAGYETVLLSRLHFPPPETTARHELVSLRIGGAPIAGRVLDPKGVRLEGVAVVALARDLSSRGKAVSGLDGRFSMRDLAAGDYVLSVSDPRWVCDPIEGIASGGDDVVVRVAPPESVARRPKRGSATLVGVAIDSETKEPVQGATITLVELSYSSGPPTVVGEATQAGVEGFYMENVPFGPHQVVVRHEHYADSRVGVLTRFGELPPLTIPMFVTTGVFGTVLWTDGSPVVGARVTLKEPRPSGAPRVCATDSEGGYRFLDVARGRYFLSASRHEAGAYAEDGRSADGDELPVRLSFYPGQVREENLRFSKAEPATREAYLPFTRAELASALGGPGRARSSMLTSDQFYGDSRLLPFDSARWKELDESDPHRERFMMVYDFLRRYRLMGMRLGEVRSLLGPTRRFVVPGPRFAEGYFMRRPASYRSRDPTATLVLDFDEQMRVVHYQLDPDWSP